MAIQKMVFACFCMVGLVGCSSYQVSGRLGAPINRADMGDASKYHIVHLTVDSYVPPYFRNQTLNPALNRVIVDPWSVPQVMSRQTFVAVDPLRDAIERVHPDLFSNDEQAERIDVKVICAHEKKGLLWTILVPYLVSLGTLPALNETVSSCNVEVYSVATGKRIGKVVPVEFTTSGALTVFTPFGLSAFTPVYGAISQRTGNGIMANTEQSPIVREDFQSVFVETVSEALVHALK